MLRLTREYLKTMGRRSPWTSPALAALLCGGCVLSDGNVRPVCSPPYFRKIDDHCTAHAAIGAARHQLSCMTEASGVSPSSDYAFGFQQAYVDIAQGGSGMTPVVPPRRYWGDRYRTQAGHAQTQEWFAGYAAGASRACACYRGNTIATSWSGAGCDTSANCTWGRP
jgi:hypothetical protein